MSMTPTDAADELQQLAIDAARVAEQYGGDGESPWAGLPTDCRRFLAAYAVAGSPSRAAAASGVPLLRHHRWLGKYDDPEPGYPDAFATAQLMAAELLESEARRRALIGWQKPIFQRGQLVGYERRYSDTLMLALLAAERPDKYGRSQSQVTLTGPGGGPLQSITLDVRDVSDADLMALLQRASGTTTTDALPGGLPPALLSGGDDTGDAPDGGDA